MEQPTIDILLAQRFAPEFGGSIAWMTQVYSRWPHPVEVVTHNYYDHPINPDRLFQRPASGDHVSDNNFRMDRRDIFLHEWGLDRPGKLIRYRRMNRAVRERLKRPGKPIVRVHCIHAVPEAVSLIPLRWRYGRRLKIICYAHGEEITACASSRQLKFLMHRAHLAIDLMIANSGNTQRLLANHIDADKVKVMHPGVDLAAFENATEAGTRWRQENGLQEAQIILTVARLESRKNQLAVMRAVSKLVGNYPNLKYVIAGDGSNRESLQQEATNLNLLDHVIFTGEVDGETKGALYGACDVFAMPAIQHGTDIEGFGMVFIEAGACGKPSVAGNIGGQPEAVVDGKTGFVVDGNAVDEVASALDQLLSDDALRTKLGIAARAHAEMLDWSKVVQRTVELVEKI